MATPVQRCELPEGSVLRVYAGTGGYADCYAAEVPGLVTQAAFVETFYTGRLFKLERLILAVFAGRPCTDLQAGELARGERDQFAAWGVEQRAPDQLLLRDFTGRTRSWLMTAPAPDERSTRLLFGSAVVPVADRRTGELRMGAAFRVLLGFHQLYSRLLLQAAAVRLAAAARRAAQAPH